MKRLQPEIVPLLAIGAVSLVWQVASARAVLAGLYGNELTIGLVLGTWLVLIGLSTAGAARLAPRRDPKPALAAVLLSLPVAMVLSLLAQFLVLPAYGAMDQVSGPGRAALAALLCLAPSCLLLGAAFGLVSLVVPEGMSPARWAARIYVLESLGTTAVGLVFHAVLADLSQTAVGLIAGLLAWLAGLSLLWRLPRRLWLLGFAAVGLLAAVYLVPGLRPPGAGWLERPVAGYEVLARQNSPHAELAVLRRGDQVLFLANGVVVFTTQDEALAAGEVHLGLLAHPAPRRVLLIGGGLGGGLREVLRHPVERVDYVELDPEMVRLARRHGGPALTAALDDRRVRLRFGDGRQLVAASAGVYDAILVGLPDPSSALINRFYTEEFFESARVALRPGGLVRVGLHGSETYLDDDAAVVHATVFRTMSRVFGNAAALPGQRTVLLAGKRRAPALDPATLARRLAARGVDSDHFSATELTARTLPLKRELYRQRIDGVGALINRDLHPVVYFHASLSWLAVSSGGLARVVGKLGTSFSRRRWVVLGGAFLVALALGLLRRRGGAPGLGIFIAGVCGLAIEVCLLLATQEVRGVVYHEIGVLLTAFMIGLALGAPVGRRLVSRWPDRALLVAVGLCGAVALLSVGALHLAVSAPSWGLVIFLANMTLLGAAVGACYPAASALFARRLGAGGGAARAYAWDLVGAATGSLFASGFLLPVLGLPGTCLFCAALCLGFVTALLVPSR